MQAAASGLSIILKLTLKATLLVASCVSTRSACDLPDTATAKAP